MLLIPVLREVYCKFIYKVKAAEMRKKTTVFLEATSGEPQEGGNARVTPVPAWDTAR